MPTSRPIYESLNSLGLPYNRLAQTIDELPHKDIRDALKTALPHLSSVLGLANTKPLAFGVPIYYSFGLNHREATRHPQAKLLMTKSCDLSLDFVDGYTLKKQPA